MLHQMFRVRWAAWRAASAETRARAAAEAQAALSGMQGTAAYTMLGHKGDLLLAHFRKDFAELSQAETAFAKLEIGDYLEVTSSYLSMVELGLYESTAKVYGGLAEKGVAPFTAEWNAAIDETTNRQKQAMAVRLWPAIPDRKYICFYPMDRKRGEDKNWYMVPMAERQRMMSEHGAIGRRYAGEVQQIIGGSIGFDDWEWSVTLFADEPLVFKKLIYEMRFDEVSAMYALFGTFFVGLRLTDLPGYLAI